MSHLSVLSDSLLLLGKSIDPDIVTKVLFAFEHAASDIGLARWKFKVSLVGTKGLDEATGQAEVSFNQSWDAEGATDEEAVLNSFRQVGEYIKTFHHLREAETGFAEQALLVLNSSGIPQNLWSTQDPALVPVDKRRAEEDLAAMARAAGEANGQTSSV